MYKVCLFWLLGGLPMLVMAQQKPVSGLARHDSIRVEAIPGETEISSPGKGIRRYANGVRLQHRGLTFSGDEAIHYLLTNRIDVHGHVLMIQGDSISGSSDSARYDGNTGLVTLRGNVLFEHHRTEITTPHLDYDLSTGVAAYMGKSRLTDGPNILTSFQGRYDVHTRRLRAYRQVALATPHTTLRSDSLWYVLTANPTPVVDLAQAIFIDQTDLTREHSDTQRTIVTASPTRVAAAVVAASPTRTAAVAIVVPPQPERRVAGLANATPTRKANPAASGSFRRLAEQSRPLPGSSSTVRGPDRPADSSAEVSDLERILNRPKRSL